MPGDRVSLHAGANADHSGTVSLTVFADVPNQTIIVTGPSGYERQLRHLVGLFSVRRDSVDVDIGQLNPAAGLRRSFAEILNNERPDRMERAVRSALSAVLLGLAGAMVFGVVVTGSFAGLNAAFRHSKIRDVVRRQIINLIAAAFTAVAHEMVFRIEALLRKVFLQAVRRLPTREANNWQRIVMDLVEKEVGAVFIVGGLISGMAALPATTRSSSWVLSHGTSCKA